MNSLNTLQILPLKAVLKNNIPDKRHIKLYNIKWQSSQSIQRTVTFPKIIHLYLKSLFSKPIKQSYQIFSYISGNQCLCHLFQFH